MLRLTLRYLLAYLDDQLEPADAQAMSQLIEASPFATDLMHRVHDVSRRLKLAAPKLKARGLAGDANTVAEYLDHTMPADQVVEFEKICLTSDVHLAEVASAHQILALVLRERADVDVALRRRMYTLPDHAAEIEGRHDYEESGAEHRDDEESVVVEPASPRRRPEIPEWLREQPRRQFRWVPVMAAALLLAGTGIATYLFFAVPDATKTVATQDAPRTGSGETPETPEGAGANVVTLHAEPSTTPVETEAAPKGDHLSHGDNEASSPPESDVPFHQPRVPMSWVKILRQSRPHRYRRLKCAKSQNRRRATVFSACPKACPCVVRLRNQASTQRSRNWGLCPRCAMAHRPRR